MIRYGLDPERPYLLFVGRITRQKGIMHLVNAIPAVDPKLQIVLCAGAPDTPEIAREMEECQSALKFDPRSASNRDPCEAVGSGLSR